MVIRKTTVGMASSPLRPSSVKDGDAAEGAGTTVPAFSTIVLDPALNTSAVPGSMIAQPNTAALQCRRPFTLRQTEVRCRTDGREIFRCIRAPLKPDNARQVRDAGNLGVAVIGIGRLVTAIDPDLVLDPEVMCGHQIVTERG